MVIIKSVMIDVKLGDIRVNSLIIGLLWRLVKVSIKISFPMDTNTK